MDMEMLHRDKEEQIVALLIPQQEEAEEEDDESSRLVARKSHNHSTTNTSIDTTTTEDDYDEPAADNHINNSLLIPNGHPQLNGTGNGEKYEQEDEEEEEEDVIKPSSLGLNGILHHQDDDNNKKKKILLKEPIIVNGVRPIVQSESKNNNTILEHHTSSSPSPLVFYDNTQGVEPTNGNVNGHTEEKIDTSTHVNGHTEEKIDTSTHVNGHTEAKIDISTPTFKSIQEIESAEDNLVNEDDLDEVDLDVENVLQKQTTHELFCPKCKSCITKRVILRKRKRILRVSSEELKRTKNEAATESDSGIQTEGGEDTQLLLAEDEERNTEPDVFRCLSCFSFFIPSGNGFKLFRKSGDKRDKQSNVEDEQQVPNVRKNWFSFMFQSNSKQETAVEQGGNLVTERRDRDDVIPPSSSNIDARVGQSEAYTGEKLTESKSTGEFKVNRENDLTETTTSKRTELTSGASAQDAGIHSHGGLKLRVSSDNGHATLEEGTKLNEKLQFGGTDARVGQSEYTGEKLTESKSTGEFKVNRENDLNETTTSKRTELTSGVSAQDAGIHSHGGLKLRVSSDNGHATLEEGTKLNEKLQFGGTDNEPVQHLPISAFPQSNTGENVSLAFAIPHAEQQGGTYIFTESVAENKNTTFASSEPGEAHPSEISQHITTKAKYEVHTGETLRVDNMSSVTGVSITQGKDTVITIDTRPAEPSQILQGLISPDASASALHSATHSTIGNPAGRSVEGKQIEVIKSIVYGGLAEAITSLSVVSSAAGGGAATLNILALGMANLIGGFFVICHNLWELRCDRIEQVTNQITDELTNEKDRYRKVLGRRENFILHSVVAIISYLIFGLLPPVVYGFSFYKSDDKEFKLLAVAAASLVSILCLAAGKAYVQRPPKHYIKCIITFVMLGVMVSGVSYAAGILVERLLEKFHLFEQSPVTNLLVPRTTGTSSWSSY